MKCLKKMVAAICCICTIISLTIPAFASESVDWSEESTKETGGLLKNDILFDCISSGYFALAEYDNFANPKLVDAYIEFSKNFPEITNISLDMFVSLYQAKKYDSEEKYLNDFIENIIYYEWQEVTYQPEVEAALSTGESISNRDNGMVNDARSASGKWYYNTGTSLPQKPTYGDTYNLKSNAKIGDIVYEAKGSWGITGHIAVVEGMFYDTALNELYIRVIEAISDGVTRGILDDQRFAEREGELYRVSTATISDRTDAVVFCRGQLGKPYMVKDTKSYSENNMTWYCSELAWAAYYATASINLDDETSSLLPVTPRNIRGNSNLSFIVSYN